MTYPASAPPPYAGRDLRPTVKHPLMGARLSTLIRAFARNGPVAPAHAGLAAVMVLSAAARGPFRVWDRVRFARLRRSRPRPEPPLFVIGHWRTGTTHLHNLLGRSPAFGHISPIASGLPNEILTLGTWLRPLLEKALPTDRHVDRVSVTPTSPQEDEIPLATMQPLSVFHALYFPKRFREQIDRGVFFDGASEAEIARWAHLAQDFSEKIAVHQDARRLVIKNPVYTARIARLREIWSGAQFAHIRRNPYEVFVSTRHYFRKLMPELALQAFDTVDIEDFVLTTFARVMAAYEEQSRDVPADQLIEVSYERLKRTPIEVLADIHAHLALPDWEAARPRIAAYLEATGGYRTNAYEISASDRAKVDAHWADAVAAWERLPR